MMSEPQAKTPPLLMAAAWAVVTIPLAWGVYETAIKALPLFAGPIAPAAARPEARTILEKTGRRSSEKGWQTEGRRRTINPMVMLMGIARKRA